MQRKLVFLSPLFFPYNLFFPENTTKKQRAKHTDSRLFLIVLWSICSHRKKVVVKLWTLGFGRPRVEKRFCKKNGTFQICPNLSGVMPLWGKSAWAGSPHGSPSLLLELSDKRRGWTLPQWNSELVSFLVFCVFFLKMVSQFKLAFSTNRKMV